MRVYKPQLSKRRITNKDGSAKKLKKWWIVGRDHNGTTRHFPGLPDKQRTVRLKIQLEKLIEQKQAGAGLDANMVQWLTNGVSPKLRNRLVDIGLIPRSVVDASKPLRDHIESFKQYVAAKERTPHYVQQVVGAVTEIVTQCKFSCVRDVSAAKVKKYLDGRRDKGAGISKRRYNFLLSMVKYFLGWAVKHDILDSSPLNVLDCLDNPDTDARHLRRSLTVDEVRRLLENTVKGNEAFGMTGYERYLLYRFTVETGLRAKEIRTLTVQSFDFDRATVTVKAAYSKHRKEDLQPLRPQLVMLLKQAFENKLPNVKVFGGRYKQLTDKTADMLKRDLVAAGISYVDECGRYADFHALRHTFVTSLRNASRGKSQVLARHESSKMTDRYTHLDMEEGREALELLPDYSLPSIAEIENRKNKNAGA